MKNIQVLIYRQGEENKAVALVTDCFGNLLKNKEITYPCNYSIDEIIGLVDVDLLNQDHSFDITLIGTRPPRRR